MTDVDLVTRTAEAMGYTVRDVNALYAPPFAFVSNAGQTLLWSPLNNDEQLMMMARKFPDLFVQATAEWRERGGDLNRGMCERVAEARG